MGEENICAKNGISSMRIPRIHHPEPITTGSQIALSDDAANHVGRVLRMGKGLSLIHI